MGSHHNSFSFSPSCLLFSLEHRHSPALVHLPWRLLFLERTSPRPPYGHSFMFSTSLLKGHLFSEAPVHPSNTATCPVPTHSYSASPSSEHLPTYTGNTSLTRLTVMLCPFLLEHIAHGGQGFSVVSSLSSPRCKKSVSCLHHTTNIS